jgi:Mn-dependent DtxR family transcriptional regulator
MKTKIIEMRDVSVDEAARLIDDYISKNAGKHFVSELSEKLGIELGTVFKAAQKLIESGEAKKCEY